MPAHLSTVTAVDPVEAFIARWSPSGGAELSNYGDFITELCTLIGTAPPNPTVPEESANTYVKEKAVTIRHADGAESKGRIDCYKQNCFVLEAKQGVDAEQPDLPLLNIVGKRHERRRKGHGVRGSKAWDDAMIRARAQAEKYARALPEWPPFLIVVDVGHEIQLFADFGRTGKGYAHFPDATGFRIRMADLRNPDTRALLKAVWEEPLTLDPSLRTAKVTREIARNLAELAKSLEAAGHSAEAVATFLMRCLFTMFAEDVELLPKDSFKNELKSLRDNPKYFVRTLTGLWKAMNEGGACDVLRMDVLRFNGGLFKNADALPLSTPQIDLLIEAASANWKDVEPAIFGTLLERALEPRERHKLGAHYTPRAYVERLVIPTVIEPLREEWDNVKAAALTQDKEQAAATVREFHARLCTIRVLDPACGTGNFLYVALELMKRLEGEVLDLLALLEGGDQGRFQAAGATVDPHQFLGIEINPRAAAIAELVLWIGYLQWHFRTFGRTIPAEPILRDFHNIECRDAILAYDRTEIVRDATGKPVTRWDGVTYKKHPVTGEDVPDEAARVEVLRYIKPRPAKWPKADFIVGNPPFIGNKRMRAALGDGYVETLRATYGDLPESIDYVMYWWFRASRTVFEKKSHRFGLITTNSITQTYNRFIIKHHAREFGGSLVFAIGDHPWVDSLDGAAVRVAMTVGVSGKQPGQLLVTEKESIGTDSEYKVEFVKREGFINDDLTIGPNLSAAKQLLANDNLAHQGVTPLGEGFRLTEGQLANVPLQERQYVKPYIIGRDLTQRPEHRYIIDFFGTTEVDLQTLAPYLYQIVFNHVRPERLAKEREAYRDNWWIFAEPRQKLRGAMKGLARYLGTCRTAKHRLFSFLQVDVIPDAKVVAICIQDAWALAILSSAVHAVWAASTGAWLGVGNDSNYNHSECFGKFPFPDPAPDLKARIRELGERLDGFRKARQAEHPDLTLTQMYNVLERLRELDADPAAKPLDAKEKAIHDKGLISVLRQIHDELDRAVFDAYGWPHDLTDEQILERLVALNKERAAEERRGIVRWLRPEFQAPAEQRKAVQESFDVGVPEAAEAKAAKLPWPKKLPEQVEKVHATLAALGRPATVKEIARSFKSAPAPKVEEVLDSLTLMGKASLVGEDRYAA